MPTLLGYLATFVVIAVLVGVIVLYHLGLDRRYGRGRARPVPAERSPDSPGRPASATTTTRGA